MWTYDTDIVDTCSLRGVTTVALARYSDRFWLTSGALAVGAPVYIFPVSVNTLAPLYADAAGTIPLPNPTVTNSAGVITFYAAVGEYWLNIANESFFINVGMSHEQADLSTGIASGGELDVAGTQSITIHPLMGYIIDNTSIAPESPIPKIVDFPGATVSLDTGGLTRTITWWLLDSDQNVIQQAARPNATQHRSHLVLGASIFDIGTLTILEVQTLHVILAQQANQLVSLMDSLGPFSISGNVVTPNGANLQINKSAGVLFARSFNLFVSGVMNDDPHVSNSPAQTPAVFRRILRTVSSLTPSAVTTLDPANFDLNGVLTPVGGGANRSTIQRIWLFAMNSVSLQIAIQYGQTAYNSLADATAAIGGGTFISAPITADAALIGYVVVTRTATNLSDPTQATFIKTGKFSTP